MTHSKALGMDVIGPSEAAKGFGETGRGLAKTRPFSEKEYVIGFGDYCS